LKGKLDSLSDVKLTSRLKESPVVLVTESGGFSASQERFLRKIGRGQEGMESKRVMEINPEHTLVQKLRDLHEEKSDSPKLLEGVQTLYDLALLAEGSKVHDLGGFMKRVQEAVLKGL
jgi:molecular chaperone HtpG